MTKYIRNSKTISGRLHDELVMMDPDQGKYFALNSLATRIWDILAKPMDLDKICGILMGEYDVDPDQCRVEVAQLLKELSDLGLVFKTE